MRVNCEFFADFRLSLCLVWVVSFSFAEIIAQFFIAKMRYRIKIELTMVYNDVLCICPDLNGIENHHTDLIPCLSFIVFFFFSLLSRFLLVFDLMCSIFLATISIWWMQQNGKFVDFSLSPSFSSIFLSFSRTCARDTISSAWRLRVLVWNDANSLATFASFEKFSFVTSWKQMEKFQLLIFTAQINKMYEGRKKNK